MRRAVLANDEIYHVFNRSIEQRPVFVNKRECQRALLGLDFYRFKDPPLRLSKVLLLNTQQKEEFFCNLRKGEKLIDVISYSLMPSHFHFLLKQKTENGIAKFTSNFTNSYTRYFNTKHQRNGPLFEGIFKAVRIESDEQLVHVSRYIHINPVTSFIVKEELLDSYPWSSLPEFLGQRREEVCEKKVVLDLFSSPEEYRKFVHDQIDYAKKLELIRHLLLE